MSCLIRLEMKTNKKRIKFLISFTAETYVRCNNNQRGTSRWLLSFHYNVAVISSPIIEPCCVRCV